MHLDLSLVPKLYRTSAVLGLGLWILLLSLGTEWIFLKWLNPYRPEAASVSLTPLETDKSDVPPFLLQPDTSFQQITERPLFMESRKPGAIEADTAPIEQKPPTPLTLKLKGIVSTQGKKVALLQDAKGKYAKLKIRDKFENWQLMEISEDRVVLRQYERVETLILVKKSGGMPSQPPPQATPQNEGAEGTPPPENPNEIMAEPEATPPPSIEELPPDQQEQNH